MIPKNKRIVNKKLLEEYREKPCILESKECEGQVWACHIQSRGAWGNDVDENLFPGCDGHHTIRHDSFHRKGVLSFYNIHKDNMTAENRVKFEDYLESRGLI